MPINHKGSSSCHFQNRVFWCFIVPALTLTKRADSNAMFGINDLFFRVLFKYFKNFVPRWTNYYTCILSRITSLYVLHRVLYCYDCVGTVYIFKHESTHLSQIFKWAFVNKFIFCRTVGFIITIPSYIQMQSWLNVFFVLAFSN